jgi:hypothetical protein
LNALAAATNDLMAAFNALAANTLVDTPAKAMAAKLWRRMCWWVCGLICWRVCW